MQHPQLALGSEETLQTRLGPRPPHRSPNPDGAVGFHPCPSLTARTKGFCPAPVGSSRIRVLPPLGDRRPRAWSRASPHRDGMPLFRADCMRQSWQTHAHEGLPRPDLSRTPPVTRWSRHRLEADTAGPWSGRSLAADLPSRRTSPALAKEALGSRAPPYVLLAQAARGAPPVASGRFRGPMGTMPSTRVDRTAPLGSAGISGCSHNPFSRGRGPPHPPLREERRDRPHPRCLPSKRCLRPRHRACAQSRFLAGHPLSRLSVQARARSREPTWAGCFPQLLTSLWRAHDAFFVSRPDRLP
jgi:hypothetical protein